MSNYELSEIRPLRARDVIGVLRVIGDVRKKYGLEGRVNEIIEPSDRDLFVTYERERSEYFVAHNGAVTVGGAGIAPLASTDSRTCELQRMYLHSEYRRCGIGKMLLNECVKAAKAFGYCRCYAETVNEMKEAISFYQATGFRLLAGPIGDTGHRHNNCWMILDFA
jgi:putative acetyltransferase